VVKRNNPRAKFDKVENNLLREDELEFMKLMVSKKIKEVGKSENSGNAAFLASELSKLCEPII